mmetsp:Transcript_176321/g.565390  ORF Transcript_176321/g.565390 Transcript_176321/m.565390 type:complete len:208 (+) Transcript_176321:1510-2133(+)
MVLRHLAVLAHASSLCDIRRCADHDHGLLQSRALQHGVGVCHLRLPGRSAAAVDCFRCQSQNPRLRPPGPCRHRLVIRSSGLRGQAAVGGAVDTRGGHIATAGVDAPGPCYHRLGCRLRRRCRWAVHGCDRCSVGKEHLGLRRGRGGDAGMVVVQDAGLVISVELVGRCGYRALCGGDTARRIWRGALRVRAARRRVRAGRFDDGVG